MKKQTAVEWLIDEIRNHIKEHGRLDAITISKLKIKAKSIEKDIQEHDIGFAYMAGFNRGLDNNPNHLEEYMQYIRTLGL